MVGVVGVVLVCLVGPCVSQLCVSGLSTKSGGQTRRMISTTRSLVSSVSLVISRARRRSLPPISLHASRMRSWKGTTAQAPPLPTRIRKRQRQRRSREEGGGSCCIFVWVLVLYRFSCHLLSSGSSSKQQATTGLGSGRQDASRAMQWFICGARRANILWRRYLCASPRATCTLCVLCARRLHRLIVPDPLVRCRRQQT
jgi:hypothetical protein